MTTRRDRATAQTPGTAPGFPPAIHCGHGAECTVVQNEQDEGKRWERAEEARLRTVPHDSEEVRDHFRDMAGPAPPADLPVVELLTYEWSNATSTRYTIAKRRSEQLSSTMQAPSPTAAIVTAPPKRGRGRPGVSNTSMQSFEQRRVRNVPLPKLKIEEARAIRGEWPKDGAPCPEAETIVEHISVAFDKAKATLSAPD